VKLGRCILQRGTSGFAWTPAVSTPFADDHLEQGGHRVVRVNNVSLGGFSTMPPRQDLLRLLSGAIDWNDQEVEGKRATAYEDALNSP
jgi:hypothetical protein